VEDRISRSALPPKILDCLPVSNCYCTLEAANAVCILPRRPRAQNRHCFPSKSTRSHQDPGFSRILGLKNLVIQESFSVGPLVLPSVRQLWAGPPAAGTRRAGAPTTPIGCRRAPPIADRGSLARDGRTLRHPRGPAAGAVCRCRCVRRHPSAAMRLPLCSPDGDVADGRCCVRGTPSRRTQSR